MRISNPYLLLLGSLVTFQVQSSADGVAQFSNPSPLHIAPWIQQVSGRRGFVVYVYIIVLSDVSLGIIAVVFHAFLAIVSALIVGYFVLDLIHLLFEELPSNRTDTVDVQMSLPRETSVINL